MSGSADGSDLRTSDCHRSVILGMLAARRTVPGTNGASRRRVTPAHRCHSAFTVCGRLLPPGDPQAPTPAALSPVTRVGQATGHGGRIQLGRMGLPDCSFARGRGPRLRAGELAGAGAPPILACSRTGGRSARASKRFAERRRRVDAGGFTLQGHAGHKVRATPLRRVSPVSAPNGSYGRFQPHQLPREH